VSVDPEDCRRPVEVFITVGKGGDCRRSVFDGLAGVISKSLQDGMDASRVIKLFHGISCPAQSVGGPASCLDWFGEILQGVVRGDYDERG